MILTLYRVSSEWTSVSIPHESDSVFVNVHKLLPTVPRNASASNLQRWSPLSTPCFPLKKLHFHFFLSTSRNSATTWVNSRWQICYSRDLQRAYPFSYRVRLHLTAPKSLQNGKDMVKRWSLCLVLDAFLSTYQFFFFHTTAACRSF